MVWIMKLLGCNGHIINLAEQAFLFCNVSDHVEDLDGSDEP